MREQQPALPGLDGPEWDNPQPALPFEDVLSDDTLLNTLDVLDIEINAAEQTGRKAELLDMILYEQLGKMAIKHGLMQAAESNHQELIQI